MMGCLLTKRQQPLNVFQFDRHGQFSKHSTQVSIRFNLICLSRLNQTIQIRAGLSTLNTIREQPVLSADHNVNRTFSNRFIQRTKPLPSQLTILTKAQARLQNTNRQELNGSSFISPSTIATSPSMDYTSLRDDDKGKYTRNQDWGGSRQ